MEVTFVGGTCTSASISNPSLVVLYTTRKGDSEVAIFFVFGKSLNIRGSLYKAWQTPSPKLQSRRHESSTVCFSQPHQCRVPVCACARKSLGFPGGAAPGCRHFRAGPRVMGKIRGATHVRQRRHGGTIGPSTAYIDLISFRNNSPKVAL